MIAEILLVLAGHSSSIFPSEGFVDPSFSSLLHPGEQQCLESLGRIALRYRKVKSSCLKLSRSPSRYINALCAKLNEILTNEYEALVIETEAKVLQRDASLVGRGSFVPLSSIRASFAEWDNPLGVLESLVEKIENTSDWPAGKLIDLLLKKSETGIQRVASILTRLAVAVQCVWRAQLQAFVVHGTLAASDPIASDDYTLIDDCFPSSVTPQARESIMYVGRAIGTVKAAKWHAQMPRALALQHSKMLDSVLPMQQYPFDTVIAQIRINVSEWLWLNVLTPRDVEDAVESLANYFLMRNGEFSLSLIREIERLKVSRLTSRSGPSTVIREQDLHLALLRASLGTSAQHDPSLTHLRFTLPSGPLRPLLPSLSLPKVPTLSSSTVIENVTFDDILLGTHLRLTYSISWPLDLFLQSTDLSAYADIFAFLSSLRHVHTRIHTCWASLSNAQRARRRWTGLGEGGTQDLSARRDLLRCAWGVVRIMSWFLDVLLGYMMTDVVDGEFRRLKSALRLKPSGGLSSATSGETIASAPSQSSLPSLTSLNGGISGAATHLDFTTLRNFHRNYLDRILSGSLLTQSALSATLRSIFEVCERFTAQIERWGGDVLPELLIEGTLAPGGSDSVGQMVKERWVTVKDIDERLQTLLESFYEQLTSSNSLLFGMGDTTLMNATNVSGMGLTSVRTKFKRGEGEEDTRRLIERLLLRLDFNGGYSKPRLNEEEVILGQDALNRT